MDLRELAPEETRLAYLAIRELRPDIGWEPEFVERVNRVQRPNGYRIVASFDDHDDFAAAVAGFHVGEMLSWGHFLYVEDLVTRESARRSGHATRLLDWLRAEAERLGCGQLHLDSASRRHDAHRLYLNRGFRISGFHFATELAPRPAPELPVV